MNQLFFALAKAFKKGFSVDRLHATALEIIVPAVERFAGLEEFAKISSDGILHEVVDRAAGFES